MGQDHAGHLAARLVHAREQDDQRGAGAHQNGVDKHAERLHDALRGRVLDLRHRRDVRRTAQACFVGEQAALDAHQDGRADAAGKGRFQTEGAAHDQAQGFRYFADVHAQYHQGHADVGEGHDRHQHVSHAGDALDAAEDDQADHAHQGQAADIGRQAEGVVQRGGHGVRLHGVEAEAEGHQQQD